MKGWLVQFRKYADLSYRTMSGEWKSVIEQEVCIWKMAVLLSLLSEYCPKDVFNRDDCMTVLIWTSMARFEKKPLL